MTELSKSSTPNNKAIFIPPCFLNFFKETKYNRPLLLAISWLLLIYSRSISSPTYIVHTYIFTRICVVAFSMCIYTMKNIKRLRILLPQIYLIFVSTLFFLFNVLSNLKMELCVATFITSSILSCIS